MADGFSEERYLENGLSLIRLKRYDEAYDCFHRMSKDYPRSWKAHYGMAVASAYSQPYKKFKLSDKARELIPADIKERIDNENISSIREMRRKIKELDDEMAELDKDILKGKDLIDSRREFLTGAQKRLDKNNAQLALISFPALILLIIIVAAVVFHQYLIALLVFVLMTAGIILLVAGGISIIWVHERRQAKKDIAHFTDLVHRKEMEAAELGAKHTKKLEKRERYAAELKSALEAEGLENEADYYFKYLRLAVVERENI